MTATASPTGPQILRVAVIQMRYVEDEPVASRLRRAADLVCSAGDASLVVLPELWAHGGFAYASWARHAEELDGALCSELAALARRRRIWLHGGSFIEREAGVSEPRLWNTAPVFDPSGSQCAGYRKIHRFGFAAGEPRLLTAGTSTSAFDLAVPGSATVRAGLSTCYDLRFPELYRELVDQGVELNLVAAAWPEARIAHWAALGRARAIENQTVVAQCNLVGVDNGVVLGGRSQIIDANGDVVAMAGDSEEVIVADVDITALRRMRADFPVLADRRRGAA
ncbi:MULTISPECIES: carbon-nitrogen family hydrolase [Amycolatopsis]|uniref:Amidohydrolase n=1 Tax=Amycolatopsis echigonensis TaxID=2576905 RepID=A0A2N3WNS1_9PSEU|nr:MULTISPECIES: carbon-nitrogen family hydrolase [Amycolatopsis]PKV95503.1 putative amidohydrolase [Amycolatopsis niigatensis]